MPKILKALRIWMLKRKLRSQYVEYLNVLNAYDCGVDIAVRLNPRLAQLQRGCNALLDKLAVLDPYSCPISRFH